jgi:CheY-like chemotaxis protein
MKFISTSLLLFTLHITCSAQSARLADSVAIRINQVTALHKSGDTEKAQLEVEDLRWFIKREKLYWPAKSITTVLDVYKSNLDEVSAAKFLEEARLGVAGIKDPSARVALANELVAVFEKRGMLDKALVLQKQLTTDSALLRTQVVQLKMDYMQKQADSLLLARQLASGEQVHYFQVEKSRAYVLLGGAAMALLALLGGQWLQRRKFEAEIDDKEGEITHLKGFLNTQPHKEDPIFNQPTAEVAPRVPSQLPEQVLPIPTNAYVPAKETHSHIPSLHEGQQLPGMYQPKYLALLVQPNRQIALYLKSLLGPEFEVEMANSHSEALEIAQKHIPDLVLTDTNLDHAGAGFVLSRQLKQDAKTNQIPVVLFSGATGENIEKDRVRADADIVLPRPLLDADLDEQIKNLLKVRRDKQIVFDQVLHLWFTQSKTLPTNPFIQQMLERIERYLSDAGFSPIELARIMQYENQVFNRKTIALTGHEPSDIIRVMRLEKAKFLLENRVAPPQVIAGLVGFDNPGAFTRAFKEHFGDTTMLLLN